MLQVTERFSEEVIKTILMGFQAHIQIEEGPGIRALLPSDKVAIGKSSDDDETIYYLFVEGEKVVNEIKILCGEVGTYLFVYECKYIDHPEGGYYDDKELVQASWCHNQDVANYYNGFGV